MAPLTEDDRALIRILIIEKHLNAYQMINEFPARNWSKNNLNRLIRQILKGRKHFTQSVMVSVAVSNLGTTASFFVTPKGPSIKYVTLFLANFDTPSPVPLCHASRSPPHK